MMKKERECQCPLCIELLALPHCFARCVCVCVRVCARTCVHVIQSYWFIDPLKEWDINGDLYGKPDKGSKK